MLSDQPEKLKMRKAQDVVGRSCDCLKISLNLSWVLEDTWKIRQ